MPDDSPTSPQGKSAPSRPAYILTLGLILAGVAVLFYLLYRDIRRGFVNEARNHAQYAAVCVAAAIPAADLAAIRGPGDADTDIYRRLQGILSHYQRAASDIRFIYLMRRSARPGAGPGDYEYVVDQPPEDTNRNGMIDADEASQLPGTPYDAGALPAMIRAWDRPDSDPDVTPDPPYGHSLSGYAPIRGPDGQTVALAGVDIADQTLYDKFQTSRLLIALYALVLALLLTATLYSHYQSRQVLARLEAMNTGLAHNNHRLTEALHLRNELSRMIMHDIRTPLSVIMGNTSLLLDDPAGFTTQDTHDMLDAIQRQANRIKLFLEDMLLLAKSEAGRLVLNRRPTDIRSLTLQEIEANQVVARLAEVSIRAEIPEFLPQVPVDADLFTRLLDNLISNAIKFSPEKGCVTLRLDCLAAADSGGADRLRLSVSDQGPGIPPAIRDVLFQDFVTSEVLAKQGKQIGLGLAFCRMVIESHQGRLYVQDNQPRGSVFVAEIPLA